MAHPRTYDEESSVIARLREICLALPGAFEKEAWGECTFRVTGGGMFAMTDDHHHGSGHVAVWVKAPPMAQEILVNADATRFFVPPYVGSKGWVGVRLDGSTDWGELAAILADGHRMSAPQRLRRRVPSASDGAAATPGTRKMQGAARTSGTAPAAAAKSTPRAKQRSKRVRQAPRRG